MNYDTFPLSESDQLSPEQPSGQVVHEVVGEFTWHELDAGSGIVDENGRELRNLEAIQLIETAHGAQDVFISSNGYLSEEAHKHNLTWGRKNEFHRQKRDPNGFKVAVVAKYPPVSNTQDTA